MNRIPLLFGWFAGLISNNVYFPEEQAGVKSGLVPQLCLNVAHRCLNGDTFVLNRVKMRTKKYETLRTGAEYSGKEFQNKGTLTVVKSSVFAISSGLLSPLARDTDNALWDSQRPGQVRNYSL